MTDELKNEIKVAVSKERCRIVKLLEFLGVPSSTFYRKSNISGCERGKPGPEPEIIPSDLVACVEIMALVYDRWGYRKLAVICRRYRPVTDRQVYRILKAANLLKKKKPRKQEILESSKLYELLPQNPNELWQTDVTYIFIVGYGFYYAITVIDYFSRYLLSCHFTRSYASDEAIIAIQKAVSEVRSIHGNLYRKPFLVTDNGTTFVSYKFDEAVKKNFSHVRIQYRTPQQLGLLERFHETLKNEEIFYETYENPFEAQNRLEKYRNLYNNVRPHWALKPLEGGDVLTPAEVYKGGRSIRIPKWQGWAKGAKEKLDKMITEEEANDKKLVKYGPK